MQYLQVKNWHEFQHYKDRNPTWIKLHKSLLDDYEFQRLQLASRALAPMFWLLASEFKEPFLGLIENNPEKLSFRLRVTVAEIDQAIEDLIQNSFLTLVSEQDASKMLADCKQVAMPEERREEKRRGKFLSKKGDEHAKPKNRADAARAAALAGLRKKPSAG